MQPECRSIQNPFKQLRWTAFAQNTPSWMTEGVLNMLLLKNIAGVTCPKVTLDAAK